MKVKIVLIADKSGEMGGRKVTIERNNTDFETIFKDLLANWLQIDFQRPHNEFMRAIVKIANKLLERPHLGWILEMKPKISVFQPAGKKLEIDLDKPIECPKCHKTIDKDAKLVIYGTANVEGFTSLEDFKEQGIIWGAHESWDEKAKCPHCKELFAVSP